MSEATQFSIGSEVVCGGGACGELRRVVINPVARVLTHLVVEARSGGNKGRLVPVGLVEAGGHEIRLSCSMAEFEALEEMQEQYFLTDAPRQPGYAQGDVLSLPLYPLSGMAVRPPGVGAGPLLHHMSGMHVGMRSMGKSSNWMKEDYVPEGEVEVRRGEHVYATDGPIGQIHGFVVDPTDHQVTHVLLDEGHMWGKKVVAIPTSAIKDISDGVVLTLTKREVGDLPPVALDE
jgi:sporulation protein YlmC with PRC-barrel domain